jgi:hypothetical protein
MSAVDAVENVRRCLNCDAVLIGAFCASCGQRAVPPNPTVRELAGDAWAELSGYDGRIARTVLALLLAPGRLTREYLDGHRARHISPVKLYLTASVIYFVIAASAPVEPSASGAIGAGGVRVGVVAGDNIDLLDAADREALRAQVRDAPWLIRPMLEAMLDDPAAFRSRVFAAMPRVFFAMLPVFAAITSLFFRGRTFPTHLTFATHLHAFAFVAASVSELAKFIPATTVAQAVGAAMALAIVVYALRAFQTVYAEPWLRTLGKMAGTAFLYLLASLPAFMLILAWASFTR